jgi:amino acid permease
VILLAALVNIFLFPGNYGIISVELVFDNSVSHNAHDIIRNLLVLLLPVLVIAAVSFLKAFKVLTAVTALCVFSLFGISLYNMMHINREFQKVQSFRTRDAGGQNEIVPVFNISKTGKNTIVIMLDRAVSGFLPYIFEESPELYALYQLYLLSEYRFV